VSDNVAVRITLTSLKPNYYRLVESGGPCGCARRYVQAFAAWSEPAEIQQPAIFFQGLAGTGWCYPEQTNAWSKAAERAGRAGKNVNLAEERPRLSARRGTLASGP